MAKLSEILGEHFKQIPEDLQKKYKDIDLVDSSNYVEKTELETANNSIKEYKKQFKHVKNTSGINGVSFDKSKNRWKAKISHAGRNINLGTFINKEDAIKARKDAENLYF